MPASPSLLIASLSAAPAGLCPRELTRGLPTALARVPDPRARRGIRHQLAVVVTAAVCAVVAGYRSYTAIAERVADLPTDTAVLLGIAADRRPSEAMIRRLLQAVDPELLATAIGTWLAARIPAPAPGCRQALAVDGKTLRGSRTRDTTARHVLAAADQHTGIVLASTDVVGAHVIRLWHSFGDRQILMVRSFPCGACWRVVPASAWRRGGPGRAGGVQRSCGGALRRVGGTVSELPRVIREGA
ncbi:transposase family protein [Dactylosporangium sp. NBC_01737]|uniref:transposase family protein n=1 Tax=Dactylosporangium sp. NBC_01737 TaxID=2975959 RepID=UPI002E0ECEB4|nr:transposase family protein [Dactylosporangium sp. NBC_01737]